MEYATNLEAHLADVTFQGMYYESMAMLTNQRLDVADTIAKDIDRRAKEAEAKAHATEEKVASVASHAIEDYKIFEDIKSE